MLERSILVTNRLGLHARAAAQLVNMAKNFRSELVIERVDGSATADAKSILSVLMLAASRGTELRLTAEGPDAAHALGAISELFASGFGESKG